VILVIHSQPKVQNAAHTHRVGILKFLFVFLLDNRSKRLQAHYTFLFPSFQPSWVTALHLEFIFFLFPPVKKDILIVVKALHHQHLWKTFGWYLDMFEHRSRMVQDSCEWPWDNVSPASHVWLSVESRDWQVYPDRQQIRW
jgi:hypothetical protein